MKWLFSIFTLSFYVMSLGQIAEAQPDNKFAGTSAQRFLINEKNDLIISNPSKRIYQNNQTVYIENDFERSYEPFSTKNRIDSESFVAKAGGSFLLHSVSFIFDRGLKSLLNPDKSKKKNLRKYDESNKQIKSKRRKLTAINP